MDPGCRNRKVDLSDLGCGRSGCRRARHLRGRARRTGPRPGRGDNAAHRNAPGGGKPARRSSHGRRGYTESGTSGRWGRRPEPGLPGGRRGRPVRPAGGDPQCRQPAQRSGGWGTWRRRQRPGHTDRTCGRSGPDRRPRFPGSLRRDASRRAAPDGAGKVGPQRRPVGVHREGRAELRSEGSVV